MFVPGNLIIIKHAEGEYSLLAHFKQNSIRVKIGDKVTKGQTIGLCGNSGNSSEPHLHFQVQNTPFFEDEASMKTFFESLVVRRPGKSEVYDNYSPEKGDIVSNNLNKD
jgi:murein DD-endopeptidase MepM/ murein hydrolase activator NlpD